MPEFACSGLASVPAGRITDRWGARVAVVANLALSAVGAGLAAAPGSYPALLAAAVLSGFGYALSGVGTSVAVVHAVSERWRTAAMVATNAGAPGIVAVSALTGPWVADRWRWEAVLGALGVGAAVTALLALRTLDDEPPERHADVERRLPKHFGWFPVGAFLMLAAFVTTLTYAVLYLDEALGATSILSGVFVGVAAAITFVVLIASSLLADRINPQTRIRLVAALATNQRIMWAIFGFVRYRIRLVVTLCLVRAVFGALILAGVVFGVGVAVGGIVGGMVVQTACLSAMLAAVADRAPRSVARATSITMVGCFLIHSAPSPARWRSAPSSMRRPRRPGGVRRRGLLRVGLVHPVHAASRCCRRVPPRRLDRTLPQRRNGRIALGYRAATLENGRQRARARLRRRSQSRGRR